MDYSLQRLHNGILEFKITRQDKRNAVNFGVMEGLKQALKQAKADDVRALVITGEGDQAFCSGGDLSVFHELRTEEQAYSMLSQMGHILYELATLPKPTVALINGTAVGGGCEIATACDFRIAKAGVKMGFIQGTLAITTGWGGGTLLFERIAHGDALKLLTAAHVHKAEELESIGFINRVVNEANHEAAEEFLKEELAIHSTVLSAYKQMLIRKWQETNIAERMEKETRQCAILWEADAHHEAVDRFLNKSSAK
ncbi:enoyl-CoA hydratase/carnithine racemase [Bacillus ectoiniformans]|uniref:enoyl-CoA hydratase/isomerase family protein n=1 Tax=Bacillus ectoiniformans TaxID=1494429 RepID=UPI00195DB166|nr:enoyl-CoA hydratase/isomerase family protein [Bacillus ectoiniformans]MBM7647230.1 enoyl-CoA hydratase/carnithine racemase [Bacillus ectoiniformans]